LIRFGFEEMNFNRIALDVYDFNERAIASYHKCGFVEEARRRRDIYREGRYVDVVMMSVLRDEWEKAR
jgi:RimJ/RimL family protein N-acetyltransferase